MRRLVMRIPTLYGALLLLAMNVFVQASQAATKVAVASNFSKTAKQLVEVYSAQGNQKPTLLFGSSGKHVAQIIQGLNVDILLAADALRPAKLEALDMVVDGSRISYARGRLVFWSLQNELIVSGHSKADTDQQLKRLLASSKQVAIANPRLAPYGLAARQAVESLGLDQALSRRWIMGENITQAFQYVKTANVDAGFIARSMAKDLDTGYQLLVPQDLHEPIDQQMVLLNETIEALKFFAFLKSPVAQAIILEHGYDLPND